MKSRIIVIHPWCTLALIGIVLLLSKFVQPQEIEEGLFEGDIMPTYESITDFYGEDLAVTMGLEPNEDIDEDGANSSNRGAEGRLTRHWKEYVNPSNGNYYVPYSFGVGTNGAYTSDERAYISTAFQDLADATGVIDFIPRTNEAEYVMVVNDGGCSSFIGRVGRFFDGGSQKMNIGWCVNAYASIQHEMLHALGFYHEQSRIDRDEYVEIHWDNIQDGAEGNFNKANEVNSLESPYDYCSVMHYSPSAFANFFWLLTITLKDGQDGCTDSQFSSVLTPFGQRLGVSDLDIEQIRQVYQCRDGATRTLSEFEADLCTDTCKCWEGATGCATDDQCIGDLVCRNQVCRVFVDTDAPTKSPTSSPSMSPSIFSSTSPSSSPTYSVAPSQTPSYSPSNFPSSIPSQSPSVLPTVIPSISPSSIPSTQPSLSHAPTISTETPSAMPSNQPSNPPSAIPTKAPSTNPSLEPSSVIILPGSPDEDETCFMRLLSKFRRVMLDTE